MLRAGRDSQCRVQRRVGASESSLWAGRRAGGLEGSMDRINGTHAGGTRKQDLTSSGSRPHGQRKCSCSTLPLLAKQKNLIPYSPHPQPLKMLINSKLGWFLVIFCGSPLVKILSSFSFCRYYWDSIGICFHSPRPHPYIKLSYKLCFSSFAHPSPPLSTPRPLIAK